MALNGTYYGSRGVAIWADFEIFQIFGGLEAHNSYQVKPTTEVKSYLYLCRYPRNVASAWAEDWSGAWPSTAPIMAPEGRNPDRF